MARKAMWAWLEKEGYLVGDAELLTKGKVEWKKKYQRDYQRTLREKKRQVVLTLDQSEKKELIGMAKEYSRPLATYVREACLAYSRQQFLFPNEQQILELREEIAMLRYSIEDIHRMLIDRDVKEHSELIDLLVDRVSYLDTHIRSTLESPSLLADNT